MKPYGDPTLLLEEWFKWWAEEDSVPAKLPDALQVRTAMALESRGFHVDLTPRTLSQ